MVMNFITEQSYLLKKHILDFSKSYWSTCLCGETVPASVIFRSPPIPGHRRITGTSVVSKNQSWGGSSGGVAEQGNSLVIQCLGLHEKLGFNSWMGN